MNRWMNKWMNDVTNIHNSFIYSLVFYMNRSKIPTYRIVYSEDLKFQDIDPLNTGLLFAIVQELKEGETEKLMKKFSPTLFRSF